jgi:hypothetical protein
VYELVRFTRMDLFEKVWTVPLREAAKEIGISDVALGKACRKSNIPLPGRGYWLRGARSRRRPPLPQRPSGLDDTVEFRVLVSKRSVAELSARRSACTVAVMPELNDPHPLIARTRRLKRKPISENGWVSLDLKQALHLKVTPSAFDRALRLMDALIKTSEKLGFIWRVLETGKTVVEIAGQTVEVALVERLTRREGSPPAATARAPATTWTYHSRIKYEPTGLLTFRIDQPTYRLVARKTWSDTPRRSLDHHLHEIVAGLPVIAAAIRTRDEEREAQRQEWEAERERRVQLAREAEGQRRLRLRMVAHMRSWERATRLRSFVAEVERSGASHQENAVQLKSWLTWARAHIERLDPITSDIKAILSLEVEIPAHFENSYHHGPKPVDWWDLTAGDDT